MSRSVVCSTFDVVPYEWLPVALAVIARRGIEPYEVMQVLGALRRRPVRAVTPEGLVMLTIWGRTDAGRPLIVTVRLAGSGGFSAMIVGARDMSDEERKEFQGWETTGR